MAPIESKRLGGKQVHREGIAGKRIHNQNVELLRRFGGEGDPRVSHNVLDRGIGFAQVSEQTAGNPIH